MFKWIYMCIVEFSLYMYVFFLCIRVMSKAKRKNKK